MSNKLTIQSHNTRLNNLLEDINKLPDAINTTDATATASDILSGKTAYVNGQKITGNIAFAPARTITPSTISQVAISSGYYTNGNITVAGDTNLVPNNIKKGVSIFGVSGGYEGSVSGGEFESIFNKTITSFYNSTISYIKSGAFFDCTNLRFVDVPNLERIGSRAFENCSSLLKVSMPNLIVDIIGEGTFANCRNLSEINIPSSQIQDVYAKAFYCCYKLPSISFLNYSSIIISEYAFAYTGISSINFSNNYISIGDYAFANIASSKLTTINITASSVVLGEGCFASNWLLSSVRIPNCTELPANAFEWAGYGGYSNRTYSIYFDFPEVKRIGRNCFDCARASGIYFPKCTYIDEHAFRYFIMRSDAYIFPECKTVASGAFSGASGSSNVSGANYFAFPKCTTLLDYAFVNQTWMKQMILPNISKIGENAFMNCYNLSRINIGFDYIYQSSCRIETSAFMSCSALKEIVINYPFVPVLEDLGGLEDEVNNVKVYVPDELVHQYESTTNWTCFNILPRTQLVSSSGVPISLEVFDASDVIYSGNPLVLENLGGIVPVVTFSGNKKMILFDNNLTITHNGNPNEQYILGGTNILNFQYTNAGSTVSSTISINAVDINNFISFFVSGYSGYTYNKSFSAISGMTFREWAESSLDSEDDFVYREDYDMLVLTDDQGAGLCDGGGDMPINPDEIIEADGNYTVYTP